ncbi:MAG: Flp pilus assembly complex ATPase component TadA [Candidatus Aenigmarchaeota archaeon]|nr:Flp pilus assembly complex ATPase component TadA [Candidatus Aenigmarchaeota archaeon]
MVNFKKYFDEQTMSVHLKQDSLPVAKKGKPGSWTCVELESSPLSCEDMQAFVNELLNDTSALEYAYEGSFILQKDGYRIVGATRPLVNGIDVTIVRNTRTFELSELGFSEELKKRILERSEGIVIAGSPGEGKSTLAQAIIRLLVDRKKIVKTLEMPRDLVVPKNVSQYSLAHAKEGELHDLLLLSRPDYTVFDEMRKSKDFSLFVDLRLAGIGLIGVVHAATPLDAVARFVGIELGMIPQVVDRVIFVQNGKIAKELSLSLEVGVPSGLQTDLARPMVVVRDTASQKQVAQLYAFGNENVLMPVSPDLTHECNSTVEPNVQVPFELKVQEKNIVLNVSPELAESPIHITLDARPITQMFVSKKGTIKIKENSPIAQAIFEGIKQGKKIVITTDISN